MADPSTDTPNSADQKAAAVKNLAPVTGQTAIPGQPDPAASNANLEETDPQVVAQLRTIVSQVARQTTVARRLQIQRVGKAEMYWQGRQHIWWNDNDGKFYDSSQTGVVLPPSESEQPRFTFTKNYYAPFGESFVAALTQMIPKTPFRAVDPNNEDDIRATRAATDAAELIARDNDAKKIVRRLGYHGYTGSLIATYTRWVADGNTFGWQPEPQQQLEFGMMQPADPTQDQRSAVTGTQNHQIPKGQVVITVHGAAEINVPIWASEQADFSYLNWQTEVPRSLAKATFPWCAEKIAATGQITADDSYARLYRTAVRENLQSIVPSDALEDLVTLNRIWLEPWTFEDVQDKAIKDRLKQLFPKGCYVCFAGSTYCESKNQARRDHWDVRQCLEGEGQSRRAAGEGFLDLQDAINTLFNLAMEYLEYGIPYTYHGSETVNSDAINKQTAKPGMHIPCKQPKPGENLSGAFFIPEQVEIPQQLLEIMEALQGQDGQFVTGMFPAMFGGPAKGAGGDTAAGYEMQRDQAMGRLVAIYDQFKLCYQNTMMLAVREYAKNQSQDVALASKNPAQKPRMIATSAIKKGNFATYPEADEAYPLMYSEKRASLEKLMGMAKDAPELATIFTEPANMEYIAEVEGLTEIEIPGKDSRDKQLREIEVLLQAAPLEYDPEAGIFVSSMAPEPRDRDDFETAECDRYLNSDEGQEARYTNIPGYQNIVCHAFMHQEAKQMKANPQMLSGRAATGPPALAANPQQSGPSPTNGAGGNLPAPGAIQ